MSQERSFSEKVAEFSKKLDIIQFMVGGFIFIFNPAVGGVIIVGSAITYVGADQFQKWREGKRAEKAVPSGKVIDAKHRFAKTDKKAA